MTQTSDFSFASPFSGMFVPRSLKTSSLDEILNQPNAKLEDLMDNEDFPFEIKNANPRLLDYFSRSPSKIKQLLDYVIRVPTDMNDNKRAYQYPLLANEIFESDITVIMNLFFVAPSKNAGGSPWKQSKEFGAGSETNSPDYTKNQISNSQDEEESALVPGELLNHLFSFIYTKEELNPVLSSYFKTIVQKLMRRNQKKFVDYVYSDEKILLGLVEHIEEHSIAELIPPFLCYEHYLFDDKNPKFFDIKLKVIEKLMNTMRNTAKPEGMTHMGDLLHDTMQKRETMADGKEIMNKILSKETFDTLFGVLKTGPSNAVIINIGNILTVLLGQYSVKKISSYGFGFSHYVPATVEDDPIANSICENVEVLTKLLLDEKPGAKYSATYGQNVKPLGLGKLKIVEIVERIMKLENRRIHAKIFDSGIIQIITDMFSKFVWNNMLHIAYEKLVYTIVDRRDVTNLVNLLEKAGLVQVIVKDLKEDQFQLPKNGRKVRKGHMGHLTRIANDLVKLSAGDKILEEIVKRNPEWELVVLPALKAQNDLDNQEIGGCHPRAIQAQLLGEGFGVAPSTPSLRDSQTGLNVGSYLSLSNSQADQQPSDYSPMYAKSPIVGGYMAQSGPGGFSDAFSLFAPTDGTNLSYDSFQLTPLTPVEQTKPIETAAPVTSITPFEEIPVKETKPIVNVTVTAKKESTLVEPKIDIPANIISEVKIPEFKETRIDFTLISPIVQKAPVESEKSSKVPPPPTNTNNANKEKEDIFAALVPRKSESDHLSSPAVSEEDMKPMRNSMIDMKSGKKMKLKLKRADKFDGNKILDMINKCKSANPSLSSLEFSYSDNNQSESENLVDDTEIQV